MVTHFGYLPSAGATETSQLLLSMDALSDCLLARVNQKKNQSIDNKIYECTRNALKVGILGISLVGNASFVSLNYTESINEYLADVCAASNLTIMTVLMLWAGNSILDEILTYQTPEEVILTTKQFKNWQKIAVNTTLFSLGLISQLPYIYSAIKYNSGPFVIPFATSVGVGGAIFPMRSLQLSLDKFLHQKAADKIDPTLFKQQKKCVESILSQRDKFIKMSMEEKIQFINQLTEIRREVDGEAKIQKYLSQMISMPTGGLISQTTPLSVTNIQIMSVMLACLYEFGLGLSTWRQTKEEVLPNDLFAGILAVLVVASTSHIMLESMIESTEHLSHSISNDEDENSSNITSQLYDKKILTALKGTATATNVLALLVTYVMFNNLSEDKWEQLFMEVVMCSSTFLLYQKSTFDTLEGALIRFKKLFGSENQKKTIEILEEFEDLAHFSEAIHPDYFNAFISKTSLITNNC